MKKSSDIIQEVKNEIKVEKKAEKIIEESNSENSDDMEDTLKILDVIEEATTSGMQMRTYESKKAAAIGAIAVAMAKKNKDPLYDRLKHFRGAWKGSKDEILQRYYSQATQRWQSGQNR